LAMAIVECSVGDGLADKIAVIDTYFDGLQRDHALYDRLSDTYQMINDYFIAKPHRKLIEKIIKGKSTPLGTGLPAERLGAVEALFDAAQAEAGEEFVQQILSCVSDEMKRALEFVRCLGEVIGSASRGIILQYLSEDLIYAPPPLTPFQAAVQDSAYNHIGGFLSELLEDGTIWQRGSCQTVVEHMRKEILEDIALIKSEKQSPVCGELADYFDRRYSNLS
jgi:hypothetical protein